ncbi:Undecaprenyl-diphosphatase [Desulfacinum hydrothermale DSM 13146]|uniref:Undecaprenyl-diphosphatase n=1 Tax=Desulfacinum hydrothermale DSM 13146 TaxID=1121390 RepID=A0A1W1XF23_9BACT|nr:undecaprenyl-diphosphate phosphatase [Desulfacinum hydrothermale]SMC22457.1 Undecaprenyl-diphosphatase [Desulfacinum hydrothermale DSM 13146]
MDTLSAVALGALQGITEFLPVSSSGHLVIGQHLLGWQEPHLFFDVCLHVGTFLAVVAVFWKDILQLVRGGLLWVRAPGRAFNPGADPAVRVFWLVVVGTLPTAVMGFAFKDLVERLFGSMGAVGVNLLITGTLLWLTRRASTEHGRPESQIRWWEAVLVGIAQGFAIAPGISRSGTTIAVALFLGFNREWAGRFSFLLFVPAVLGAVLLEVLDLGAIPASQTGPIAWGTLAAAVIGYGALRLLLRVVKQGRFYVFAPYCWALGILCLVRAGMM